MSFKIDDAIEFAEFSNLAYGKISLPTVEGRTYEWIDGLKLPQKSDVQCLVIIDEGKRLVFSFRGTDDFGKWMVDANIRFKKLKNGIKVHVGFYNTVDSIWNQLYNIIKKYPNLPIYTTGHSKGAAETRQFTYRLASEKNILVKESITFGEPRSLNHKGSIHYNSFKIPTYRVMDEEDIVCRVPWRLGLYKHVDISIFYDVWGNVVQNEPWFAHIPSDICGIFKSFFSRRDALIYDHGVSIYEERLKLFKENF